MIRMLNADLKQFMGAKYERIFETAVVWAVILVGLRSSGLHLEIAPFVLWLATAVATVGGFVQVLTSDDAIDSLRGQLMLPENPAAFHASYFTGVAAYTLLTKAGLLLVLYLSLSTVQPEAVIGFTVCFLIGGAITYPLAFRSEKHLTAHRTVGGSRHHFAVYLLRYLGNNKNYLSNTVILWAFGCMFAVLASQSGLPNILPLGFALMCLNTPLGILLSSDRDLQRQVSFLPGQVTGVFLPYALFVAAVNAVGCGLYLAAWSFVAGGFSPAMAGVAALFAALSAVLTVALEARFPLLDWKVESDLWHHPRKYIVPGILVLLAMPVMILLGGM